VTQAAAYVENLIRQEPILRGIRRVRHFEGNTMSTCPETGPPHSSGYQLISSNNIEISREETIERGPTALFERLATVAEELKARQVRTMLELAGEAAKSVGNDIHVTDRSYGPEVFLEMLERISITFDEDGNPHMPTAVVSPEMGDHIRAHAQDWEANQVFRDRHAKILQRKKEEWDDRESNRQLVE
jgi:glucose-6-phosphate dehydrogenase assembly protein OpcA